MAKIGNNEIIFSTEYMDTENGKKFASEKLRKFFLGLPRAHIDKNKLDEHIEHELYHSLKDQKPGRFVVLKDAVSGELISGYQPKGERTLHEKLRIAMAPKKLSRFDEADEMEIRYRMLREREKEEQGMSFIRKLLRRWKRNKAAKKDGTYRKW